MISNIIFGILIVLTSSFFYLLALDFPERSGLFPKAILIGLFISGLMIAFEGMRKRKEVDKTKQSELAGTFIYRILVPGAIMVGTFLILVLLGFYIASACLVFVTFIYNAMQVDKKSLNAYMYGKGAIFSLAITASMYAIFTLLLGLPTPDGRLF